MKSLRKRIFRVLRKFAKSHRATKLLFEKSKSANPNNRGLKLLFPANTRWASLAITYSRLNRLRDQLSAVCTQYEFPHISPADFALVDEVLTIINAFKGFMTVLQNQHTPTISLILPGVQGLVRLLEERKTADVLPELCDSLIEGLQIRFKHVLESGDAQTDPIYLVSSCLDPVVQKRDNVIDDGFQRALLAIRELAVSLDVEVENVEPERDQMSSDSSPYGFSVPPKRSRVSTGSQYDKLKTELVEYRAIIESEAVTDSMLFWHQHKQQFATLSSIAFSVLSVPGASSAVESLFSHVTQHSTGQKSASGGEAIVRRSLLTFNEKFIDV
ncbi:transposase [Aphelenchoides avenae]|nr:transposase [Aphelenchus avenae]